MVPYAQFSQQVVPYAQFSPGLKLSNAESDCRPETGFITTGQASITDETWKGFWSGFGGRH